MLLVLIKFIALENIMSTEIVDFDSDDQEIVLFLKQADSNHKI